MQETRRKPIRDYFAGVVGLDRASSGSGVMLVNDTAETIAVTVGGLTFRVKQNETFDDEFESFDTLTLDPTTSLGTKQVETATLVTGNVTGAGDMATIVTCTGLVGSPLTVLTPVVVADNTPTKIMTKVRASLAANAAILAMFAVTGAAGAVIFTRSPRATADIANLNIDLGGTGTTAVGITQVGSSVDTTGGVAPTAIGYRCFIRG